MLESLKLRHEYSSNLRLLLTFKFIFPSPSNGTYSAKSGVRDDRDVGITENAPTWERATQDTTIKYFIFDDLCWNGYVIGNETKVKYTCTSKQWSRDYWFGYWIATWTYRGIKTLIIIVCDFENRSDVTWNMSKK